MFARKGLGVRRGMNAAERDLECCDAFIVGTGDGEARVTSPLISGRRGTDVGRGRCAELFCAG